MIFDWYVLAPFGLTAIMVSAVFAGVRYVLKAQRLDGRERFHAKEDAFSAFGVAVILLVCLLVFYPGSRIPVAVVAVIVIYLEGVRRVNNHIYRRRQQSQ